MRHSLAIGLAVVTTTLLCSTTPAVAAPAATPAGADTSAAATFGWGTPDRVDEFSGPLGSAWGVYDGPGHDGKGRRTPAAVSVAGGIMTITGDAAGNTAGMAWEPGRKYGRWEGRVRAPASDPSYNALMLLWPDAENWPVGGEVDFMEMQDDSRQRTNLFLHYGASNSQIGADVKIDATRWHDWAVEWAPDHIAAFVDGREWFRTTKASVLPPGPMHLCIQLDWFPEGGKVRPSTMEVDWVRQYPYRDQPVRTTTSAPTTMPAPTTAPTMKPAPTTTLLPTTAPDLTADPDPTADQAPVIPPTTVATSASAAPPTPTSTPAPMRTRVPALPPLPTAGTPGLDPAVEFRMWMRWIVDLYRLRMIAALGIGDQA